MGAPCVVEDVSPPSATRLLMLGGFAGGRAPHCAPRLLMGCPIAHAVSETSGLAGWLGAACLALRSLSAGVGQQIQAPCQPSAHLQGRHQQSALRSPHTAMTRDIVGKTCIPDEHVSVADAHHIPTPSDRPGLVLQTQQGMTHKKCVARFQPLGTSRAHAWPQRQAGGQWRGRVVPACRWRWDISNSP